MNKEAFLHAAEYALLQSLEVKPEESVLFLCDDSVPDIAEAFRAGAEKHAIRLHTRKIERTGRHGLDPDPETCRMMLEHPVLICATFYSLTHCPALRRAAEKGARAATLPGIDNHLFLTGFSENPSSLESRSEELMDRLRNRGTILVTAPGGTHLTFTVRKHKFVSDSARINRRGIIGNLPGGELFIAPDEGSANGKIVFDGSIGSFDWHTGDTPAFIDMIGGKAVTFSGERALKLHDLLAEAGENAFQLAEFGIGTNRSLEFTGNLLGDEKLAGTVHFAFGNSRSFGGLNNATVHIDGLVFHPDIYADGVPVMKDGVLCPLK